MNPQQQPPPQPGPNQGPQVPPPPNPNAGKSKRDEEEIDRSLPPTIPTIENVSKLPLRAMES